jgi:pimeloyl-ACP methyl ester carboxylesterase
MWTRVMAKFPPGYRLIAFDTPGFGSSDPLPQSPLIKDYAIRLLEALAELGISRANVVGHHTGAVIAAELAVLAPDLVVRLILMGPVVVRDDQEAQPWLDHINRWQLDARGDFVVEHLIPRLKLSVTTDDPGHMTAELVAYLQAGPDYTRAYEAVWRYRAAGRLPLILAPTLCVVGSAEMAALHEWTVAASGLVPHAQLLTVADATSEMAFEQPAEVASMIARFIGSAAE